MKNHNPAKRSVWLVGAVLAVLAFASVAAGAQPGKSFGTAPNIVSVLGQAQSLPAGASGWYAVRYTGGMQDEIDVSTNGVGGVSFAIYTQDEINAWMNGNSLTPIGVGSADPDEPNFDLTWLGHPVNVDGTIYYVQVTNNNMTATQFMLNAMATPLAQ